MGDIISISSDASNLTVDCKKAVVQSCPVIFSCIDCGKTLYKIEAEYDVTDIPVEIVNLVYSWISTNCTNFCNVVICGSCSQKRKQEDQAKEARRLEMEEKKKNSWWNRFMLKVFG